MMVAESLDYIANELEKATAGGQTLNAEIGKLLPKIIKESKKIIFNGDNYSAEWHKEAGKRELPNLKNTVDALPDLVKPEAIKVFEAHKVLNEREIHSRYEILLENYIKTINIEAQLTVLMANRYILPAALEYQTSLAQSVSAGKAAGVVSAETKKLLTGFTKTIDGFRKNTDKLAHALEHSDGSAEKHAKYMRDTVVPAMAALRELGDMIETTVPSNVWPLPSYREMLFIK